MIYIPGTGIIASYTDPITNNPRPEFNQALAMFIWAWFILTVIYTIAAMRSSWILFLALFSLDIELLILAVGYMLNSPATLVAGNSIGFIVGFFSCACSYCNGESLATLTVTCRLGWHGRPVCWRYYAV